MKEKKERASAKWGLDFKSGEPTVPSTGEKGVTTLYDKNKLILIVASSIHSSIFHHFVPGPAESGQKAVALFCVC